MPRDRDLHKLTDAENLPRIFPRPEFLRLGVLFGLALAVTLLVLWKLDGGSEPRIPVKGPPKPPPERVQDIPVTVDPWNPPTRRLNSIVKRDTPSDRLRTWPEAANLLAPMVLDRPHVYFMYDEKYAKVDHFPVVPMEKLLSPNFTLEYRAEPVEVRGIATRWEQVDPTDEFGLDAEEFTKPLSLGTFETEGGTFQAVFLARGSPPTVIPGQKYRVHGVFYRLRDVRLTRSRDGAPITEYVSVPLLFAKSISPMIPLRLLDELPEGLAGMIRQTKDTSYIPPAPQQDPNFYTVVGYVLKHWDQLPGQEDEVEFLRGHGILEQPEEYCLRYVETRGQIVYLRWESFEYEHMRKGDAPTTGYWHCIISHLRRSVNTPVSFLIPQEELPEGLGLDSVVRATGLFFRTHAYKQKNRHGVERYIRTPLIISTSFPVLDPIEYTRDSEPFLILMILVGTFIGACLLLLLRRDGKRAVVLESRMRKRRSERRRARGMDLSKIAENARKEQDPR